MFASVAYNNNKEMNPLGSTSTIPMPMMTSTESLRAHGFERNTRIWYLLKHNWRQLTSLIPGLVLLCATGNIHTSWTIWQLLIYVFNYEHVEVSILVAWFVGAVGGSMLGALLNSTWSKICIYYSVAVALLPVSIIFVEYQRSSYNLLLIGRSLAGILYGVTLITLISHIADNSSQFMRRYFIWTISTIAIMPTVLLAELVSSITSFRDTVASIGVLMFVLAIVTLTFMPCTYESIIFLLESGNDLRALEILLKLRNESRHYIRRDFNEFKMMLAEDCSDGSNIFSNGNSRPMYLIVLLRALNVLLSGSIIYWIFLALIWFDYRQWAVGSMNLAAEMLAISQDVLINESAFNATDLDDMTVNNSSIDEFASSNSSSIEPFVVDLPMNGINLLGESTTIEALMADEAVVIQPNISSFAKLLFVHTDDAYPLSAVQIAEFLFVVFLIKVVAGVVLMCLAERFQIYRNRILFKISLCIGIINLIFFIGTMICYRIDDNSLIFTFYMAKLLNLIYSSYLLITFSIDTIGLAELAESFSLTKRYGSVACITICEHVLHVIVILLLMNAQFKFYFHVVQSAIICIICYLLLNEMPNECLDCTLRSARDKYFVKMASTNN